MRIRNILRKRAKSSVVSRYNLFNSISYPWQDVGAQTVTSVIAPDGSNTAVRTVVNAGFSQVATRRPDYTPAGDSNFSCYVRKVSSSTNAQFRIVIEGNKGAGFDLNTGTITLSAGDIVKAMENIGNGWYRCSVGLTSVGGEMLMMEYSNIAAGDTFEWWGQQHTVGSKTVQPFQFTNTNL